MQKKVIVEMLVDVDRPDDNSILEDLEQELNCASHSIDIVSYKETFFDGRTEAELPASELGIVDIEPLLERLGKSASFMIRPTENRTKEVHKMTYDEACRLIDPATDLDELDKIIYYHGFNGKKVSGKALREASQMLVDFVRKMMWRDINAEKPIIKDGENLSELCLITDNCESDPQSARLCRMTLNGIHTENWVKIDEDGYLNKLDKSEFCFWMPLPEPPKGCEPHE